MKEIKYLAFVALMFCQFFSYAQSRKELERKRKEKEKEIQVTQRILNQTRDKKNKSLNELKTIQRQIKIREEIISSLYKEMGTIDGEIKVKNQEIDKLSEQTKYLKQEYAELVYLSYKIKTKTDLITFLLSSESVNQAIKRAEYVKQISDAQDLQLQKIIATQTDIKKIVAELETKKIEKNQLLGLQNESKVELVNDQNQNKKIVNDLQGKEKELRAEIINNQKIVKKLNNQISELIAAEIKKSQKTTNKGSTKTSVMSLTPEAKLLSENFSKNKGSLPWPVESGFISKGFGKIPHPTIKGVVIENKGVDISTIKESKARSVFSGEVRAIFSVPGMQKVVMINHGEFFTVYAHLSQVLVNKGDKVSTKQTIGVVHTDDGQTELHFEVWQNSNESNPTLWLADK